MFNKLAKLNNISKQRYKQRVVVLVRQRYSQDDEFSILRQKDEKPDEFREYNEYVEACKAEAKADCGLED